MVSGGLAEPLASIMQVSVDDNSDISVEGINLSASVCVEGL